MNDLHHWLSQQHHGLRTFRTFQQKLETLGRDDPAQGGLCRLLSGLVGDYLEAFDEAPLRSRSQTVPIGACWHWSAASISMATPQDGSPTSIASRPANCGADGRRALKADAVRCVQAAADPSAAASTSARPRPALPSLSRCGL